MLSRLTKYKEQGKQQENEKLWATATESWEQFPKCPVRVTDFLELFIIRSSYQRVVTGLFCVNKMVRLHSLFLSLFLAVVSAKHLRVVPAGYVSNGGTKLHSGSKICPADYPNGFTIECRKGMVAPVSFFVDGKLWRKTSVWPYSITGSQKKYQGYGKKVRQTIGCKSSNGGPKQWATIHFACDITSRKNQKRSNVEEIDWTRTEEEKKRWRWNGNKGCVLVNASNPLGGLGWGWSREEGGGVTFRKGDPFEGIVQGNASPLTYSFRVPIESNYAITLDMETTGWTEHNDVYLRFQYGGGLVLRRPGFERIPGGKYTKAYHNQNGRYREAKSVDNFGHSFSTLAKLKPGERYFITVGGRSTKVTVHNIILFPCEGGKCTAFDKYWGNTLSTC